MIFENLGEMIGRTPIVALSRLCRELPGRVLAKVEFMNPGGSVKDRAALSMLKQAESLGQLPPGATVIEPTSGNTGIALAMLCAARELRCVIVMPDSMSRERRQLMEAYGAEVLLTPGHLGMAGAVEAARELARRTPGSFLPDQFRNPANPEAHYLGTGPEIWADTGGNADIFVAGVGSGGTLTGAGRYLREKNPNIRIFAAEPANSPLLSQGRHGPHGIQGIGANFLPDALDVTLIDGVIPVSDEQAIETARLLAKKEGLLAGISSGAAVYAAMVLARREENAGKTVVTILPDTGQRYLGAGLF